jgi:hypothetical protein
VKFNRNKICDVNNQQIKYKASLLFGVQLNNKIGSVHLTQRCGTLISVCPDLIKYGAINTKYND